MKLFVKNIADDVNEMLLEGDVSRVVVVRYENLAEIYIDPSALSKEKYAEVQKKIAELKTRNISS